MNSLTPQRQELAAPASGGGAGAPTIKLVSYTGAQPKGFIVKKVPEGFTTLCSNTRVVILTADNNTIDCDYLPDFTNNLVISRGSGLPTEDDTEHLDYENVTINGRRAVIATTKPFQFKETGIDGRPYFQEGGTRHVSFYDPNGSVVNMQVWNNIKLTNDQVVQFAEGVTVTSDAAPPMDGSSPQKPPILGEPLSVE